MTFFSQTGLVVSGLLLLLHGPLCAQDTAQSAAYLRHLRVQDSGRRKMIDCYLLLHPGAKASYRDAKGRLHYLHHIDRNGRPVYYRERR